jgi:hypothetical protein
LSTIHIPAPELFLSLFPAFSSRPNDSIGSVPKKAIGVSLGEMEGATRVQIIDERPFF